MPRAHASVRLAPEVYDAYYRLARKRGISTHALLVRVLTDLISRAQKTPSAPPLAQS